VAGPLTAPRELEIIVSVWLIVVLLSMATYRGTRLIVKDDFPPVLWLRDRLVGGWRPLTEKERAVYAVTPKDGIGVKILPGQPAWIHDLRDVDHGDGAVASRYLTRWGWVPAWLADLLSCPWCASGWVSLALVVAVAFTVGVPAPLLVWPATWALGALLASRDWA
jgi:Protein of unknown function (DUF1360)